MKRHDIILIIVCSFLLGTVTGFLIAPIKKGIGNNCGNTYNK